MSQVCLVACASSKQHKPASAKDLYISTLFKKSRWLAEKFYDRWCVLSAKHGVVAPEEIIAPYDQTLNAMSAAERREWAHRVCQQLEARLKPQDEVTFLAGQRYRSGVIEALRERGHCVNDPTAGLQIGKQLRWLSRIEENPSRLCDLRRFYQLVQRLRDAQGGGRVLGECHGRMEWPDRGVYFLFEPGETCRFSRDCPRVVRVGTHMVSIGSKATLWNRLRNHRGTKARGGNHRGSIFRLHVGTAFLSLQCEHPAAATWGQGQSAPKATQEREASLEKWVSSFIAKVRVCWLAVEDTAGPRSDRAYLERNAIGLLAGPAGPLDPPSRHWLGTQARNPSISQSGLWNAAHADRGYDPRFLDILERYAATTIGSGPAVTASIAPGEW